MSIRVGQQTSLSNTLTLTSSDSNLITLESEFGESDILINIGRYVFGQTNNNGSQILNIRTLDTNKDIVCFKDDSIIMYQNVEFQSDPGEASVTSANAIVINNNVSNTHFIRATSNLNSNNTTLLLEATTSDDGTLYVGGYIGIGTTVPDTTYSIYATSNIHTDTELYSTTTYTSNIYTTKIGFQPNTEVYDANGVIVTDNCITISSNVIKIDFENVIITNNIAQAFNFTNADISISKMSESTINNITVVNSKARVQPFIINHTYISGGFTDFDEGGPFLINSQFLPPDSLNEITLTEIFKISPYGNLLMGGRYKLQDPNFSPSDYMIRGEIDSIRDQYFDGFLYFSSFKNENSTETEGTSFVVTKEGHLTIGDKNNSTSMVTLTNKTASNGIPIMKCYISDAQDKILHITNNATICFDETPVNTNKYDIESKGFCYFDNIETKNIIGYESAPINITSLITPSATVTNASINMLHINELGAAYVGVQNVDLSNIPQSMKLYIQGNSRFETSAYSPCIDIDDTSGYVSIGKTSPLQQLDVSGHAIISGNLGIGTTNPTSGLSVYKNSEIGKGLLGTDNGPYFKQSGWSGYFAVHNIPLIQYGIADGSCGTIYIQLKNIDGNRLANISLSFIKAVGKDVEIFKLNTHKSDDLVVTTSTTSPNTITIGSVPNCKMSLTIIGSC